MLPCGDWLFLALGLRYGYIMLVDCYLYCGLHQAGGVVVWH